MQATKTLWNEKSDKGFSVRGITFWNIKHDQQNFEIKVEGLHFVKSFSDKMHASNYPISVYPVNSGVLFAISVGTKKTQSQTGFQIPAFYTSLRRVSNPFPHPALGCLPVFPHLLFKQKTNYEKQPSTSVLQASGQSTR